MGTGREPRGDDLGNEHPCLSASHCGTGGGRFEQCSALKGCRGGVSRSQPGVIQGEEGE